MTPPSFLAALVSPSLPATIATTKDTGGSPTTTISPDHNPTIGPAMARQRQLASHRGATRHAVMLGMTTAGTTLRAHSSSPPPSRGFQRRIGLHGEFVLGLNQW
ncbi:hypothetical protein Droror1_Dr00025332 [Drosera rotundifolia]